MPEAFKSKCAGHVVDLKGEKRKLFKSQKSRNDRNLRAESKGVPGDRESEGSRRRMFVMTYRNRIKGLSLWVTGLWTRTPDSHSERERGKSGMTDGKIYNLPREAFTSSGKLDSKAGNRHTTDVKESAEGVLPGIINREGPNLLTNASFEDA